MPTEQEHLMQAARNESLYSDLCRLYTSVPKYTEWEIVALFYSALHHVEAYFYMQGGQHSGSHRERNRLIRESADFRAIARDYMRLYNLSIVARYELEHISMDRIRGSENNEYAAIKRHIRSLWGIMQEASQSIFCL